MRGKRTASLITAMCFALTGLFAVPSFAASETTTDSAVQVTLPAGSGNASDMEGIITGSAINTTDAAVNISGSAVKITGTAIDTTGTAIETTGTAVSTTGTAIDTTGTAINVSGAAISTSGTAINTSGGALATTPGAIGSVKDDERLWYVSQIPMKKEHQKLLWDLCKKRGIDYIDMLALISLESNFDEKCSSSRGRYLGYFQISKGHNKDLSTTLKTANKPLDGAVNINWGTAMYSWILADKRVKGLKDKKLRDAALSIYQRGTGGYDRYGINKSYLAKYYKKRDILVKYFEEKKIEKDHPE